MNRPIYPHGYTYVRTSNSSTTSLPFPYKPYTNQIIPLGPTPEEVTSDTYSEEEKPSLKELMKGDNKYGPNTNGPVQNNLPKAKKKTPRMV